jgi:hypothetical protein
VKTSSLLRRISRTLKLGESVRNAGAVLRGPAADPLKTLKVVVEGEIGRVKTIQMHRMAAFTWLDSRTVPNVFWSGGIIC